MIVWRRAHRFDQECLPLADRHYSRQKPGTPQFVPPGRCIVLKSGNPVSAVWVSSWPLAEYTKHEWAGAWICSMFRNEGPELSSELIQQAMAATRHEWGDPPEQGFVTFVKASAVRSTNPGYCFKRAGFRRVGKTKTRSLLAFQLLPEKMPPPSPSVGVSLNLFGGL